MWGHLKYNFLYLKSVRQEQIWTVSLQTATEFVTFAIGTKESEYHKGLTQKTVLGNHLRLATASNSPIIVNN